MAQPTQGGKSPIDRRFDLLRNKVEQEAGAVQQKAEEGLQRKAVSQGMGGSGAFTKLAQQQNADLQGQKNQALEGVEAQREGAVADQEEKDANRAFAREERLGSQDFATSMADKQMGFQENMAKAQRAFESSEAAVARGFQGKLFEKDMAFKKRVQNDSNNQFAKQMKMAMEQFNFDKEVSAFNMKMAEKQFNKKSLMEGGKYAEGLENQWGSGDPRGGF